MGFFDLLDAISIIAKGAPRHGTWTLPAQALEQPIAQMISAFVACKRSDAVDFSRKDDVVEIALNTTLKKVMDTMVKTNSHRLAVLDAERTRVVDVFTQSDALGWICRHANEPHVKELSECTIKEIGLAHKKDMHIVSVNDNTMWAYSLIAEFHISAVPVVDEAGQIVGYIRNRTLSSIYLSDSRLNLGTCSCDF